MRLIFMGTPEFAVPSLNALIRTGNDIAAIVTRPDRPRRRRSSPPEPSPVKREALKLGVPVLQPASIRSADIEARIREISPEMIVVVAFGAILPRSILRIPSGGCINVHASLLPRYRGAAPIARAILAGETVSGVTTMRMDEGLDTGAILLQSDCAIGSAETAGELTGRLASLGGDLIVDTLRGLAGGSITPRAQDPAGATHAPPLKKEEGWIDWKGTAASIAARIRACNPWPTAVALLRRKPIQLLRADVVDVDHQPVRSAPAGTVVVAGDGRLLVRCRDASLLEILELRFPGRRTVSGRDAVNGRLIQMGDLLAPKTAG